MKPKKSVSTKAKLHHRNKHNKLYQFDQLIISSPELEQFVKLNKYGNESIDFANPLAIKSLNKALLIHFYDIDFWDIPNGYLCPAVPGRADYIHYVADLLAESGIESNGIKCLDIGVGANCIYPIIGVKEYSWYFVGTEIDKAAAESAQMIVDKNRRLRDKVKIELISKNAALFAKVFAEHQKFDVVICNPPFHKSAQEAARGTQRKLNNLNKSKPAKYQQNFGGANQELWCEGGELSFISEMIKQSKAVGKDCHWFTSLVSKKQHLKPLYHLLKSENVSKFKSIEMGQGQKQSRILVWTFNSK